MKPVPNNKYTVYKELQTTFVPLRLKYYTPPAQIKHIVVTGTRYNRWSNNQATFLCSQKYRALATHKPTYQQTCNTQDLKYFKKPVWTNGNYVRSDVLRYQRRMLFFVIWWHYHHIKKRRHSSNGNYAEHLHNSCGEIKNWPNSNSSICETPVAWHNIRKNWKHASLLAVDN
jgi:hypothetical protein